MLNSSILPGPKKKTLWKIDHPYRESTPTQEEPVKLQRLQRSTAAFELLQGFFKPPEKFTLPYNGILWLEHPMVFVGEIQQPAFQPAKLGYLEGMQSLFNGHPVILTTLYDLNGFVPFCHQV